MLCIIVYVLKGNVNSEVFYTFLPKTSMTWALTDVITEGRWLTDWQMCRPGNVGIGTTVNQITIPKICTLTLVARHRARVLVLAYIEPITTDPPLWAGALVIFQAEIFMRLTGTVTTSIHFYTARLRLLRR